MDSSDTKITAIETSQQKRGEFSLTEGKGGTSGQNVYGDEMAPNGIATKTAMAYENQFKTTQQLMGQFSLTGEDSVKNQ